MGTARHADGDQDPIGDSITALTVFDLTCLSAKLGRASFASGEQCGGVEQAMRSPSSRFAWHAPYNGDDYPAIV